ncbi:MAG TPA: Gfo/Idh/MocA family oxidoreductase [Acidobacteriota bacterium]|nr:Gfo/Idh/MocA family oxidoreductase [Acidobacteriota bacterium]HRR25625.1 Gfo/Idh/MocA family oxidoreductase [Acidobacteriota bacterium]HRV07760.1 Gfo/Idh/MocA family oxidoreductase [Acidobacteriota bacterium]
MKVDRRAFLGSAGAASLAAWGRSPLGQPPERNRLKLGLIGCGWWGTGLLKAAYQVGGVETVALCDVDSAHLDAVAQEVASLQEGRRPAAFKDYCELLALPELEAVIIATPPQWHALQFLEACRRQLHIYCEKPLSHDVREGQKMVEAADANPKVIQIGFQRRQSASVRQAAEFIRSGGAGNIVQVEAQIHYQAEIPDTTIQDPPPTLDWDAWCGPAPLLPYRPSIGHFAWRLEAEYGNGHLVDWGIHWIDAVRNVLQLRMPRQVQSAGGIRLLEGKITTPDTLNVSWDFGGLPVFWRHRIWGAAEYTPETSNGIFFFGDKATVFVDDRRWEVIPRERGARREVHEVPDEQDPRLLHVAEFLEAVQTGGGVSCPVREAFQSTTTVHLAMIAYRTQSVVRWHPVAQEIEDNPEAAKLLLRRYRSPWVHPAEAV